MYVICAKKNTVRSWVVTIDYDYGTFAQKSERKIDRNVYIEAERDYDAFKWL